MSPAERDLKRQILDALGALPDVVVIRVLTGFVRVGSRGVRGAETGTADVLALVRGRAVALETKASHKPLCKCESCAAQRAWAARWQAAGGMYVLARSVDNALDAIAMAASMGGE